MAEAVAVLAGAVAQVQAHGGAAVLYAQRGEAARPRVHRALKWKVRVQLALHVACKQGQWLLGTMRETVDVCHSLVEVAVGIIRHAKRASPVNTLVLQGSKLIDRRTKHGVTNT